jgi:hypothetical protein
LPRSYRSTDDGQTFEPWPEAPHVHALAERNGKLYVAASNYDDGYAIAESDDEGATLMPLAGFGQVHATKSCVAATCAAACTYYADIALWPHTVCAGGEDAGTAGEDGGPSSPTDGPGEGAGLRGAGGGCACALGQSQSAPGPSTTLVLLASLLGSLSVLGRRDAIRRLRPGRQRRH